MRNILCAGLAAVSICTAAAKPAEAGGGGFVLGTVLGLGAGTIVGSAIARPYPYPYGYAPYGYYPYGYAPYGYYPSAYPYPVPYPYAYPPPVAYAPPGYPAPLQPRLPSAGQPAGYAPPGSTQAPAVQHLACRSGQFFNTLTGNCDRR